jgi:hypothetical protein
MAVSPASHPSPTASTQLTFYLVFSSTSAPVDDGAVSACWNAESHDSRTNSYTARGGPIAGVAIACVFFTFFVVFLIFLCLRRRRMRGRRGQPLQPQYNYGPNRTMAQRLTPQYFGGPPPVNQVPKPNRMSAEPPPPAEEVGIAQPPPAYPGRPV